MKITAKEILVHGGLFVATFLTCMISGVAWGNHDFTDLQNISYGLEYALLIMTFLGAHEFGHYFASRAHGVDATLPYFIPMPPFGDGMPFFGTFGAVIKTRNAIPNRRALFDIGVSGPLAGFVACFAFLIIGFLTLPGKEFIFQLHPEYLTEYGGTIPTIGLHFGDTLLYSGLSALFGQFVPWIPPMNELYHFPLLNVGWFGLFVTSMNMLPIGQLDGGHVVYSMFGSRQKKVARIFWRFLLSVGIASLVSIVWELLQTDEPNTIVQFLRTNLLPALDYLRLNIPFIFQLWPGWLLWALITRFLIKLDHPEIYDDQPLSRARRVLGWVAIAILVLSFSPNGIYIN